MKTIILLEMTVLAGGALVKRHASQNKTWWVAIHDSLRILIAILILTVLLLSADEVGLGTAAALFGFLVALGYVLGALGWLGPGISQVEGELFG